MVKNAGGKRTKGAARKFITAKPSHKLRLSECSDEKYAHVTKMLGGSNCSITTTDNLNLLCHIRNKFSGRNKSSNLISIGTVVLIGLRTWENPCKNCDLIEVYNSDEVDQLYQIPGINLSTYKGISAASSGDLVTENIDADFVFRKAPCVSAMITEDDISDSHPQNEKMGNDGEIIDIDSI